MDPARDMQHRRRDVAVAMLIGGAFLALFVATMAPGLPHPAGDSHEFTMSAAALRLARRTGYPLYTWLAAAFAHLVPLGDVAYRTNLLSAVLGAAGVSRKRRGGD